MTSHHPYHPEIRTFERRFFCSILIGLLLFLLQPSAANGQQSLAHSGSHAAYHFLNDTAYIAEGDTTEHFSEDDPPFDVVLLTMNVVRIGTFEIEALIFDEKAYLPVHQLFELLKIKNILSQHIDSLSGFFINPASTYLIDKSKNRIYFQDKTFRVKATDLLRTESDLYLKTDYFGKIFGLDCSFDFRSLSISLNTKLELPVIREMQQEAMRQNINKFKGEKKADTTIGRKFSLFDLGVVDWSVLTSQELKMRQNSRLNLGIGALLAGGELNAYFNYDSELKFDPKQQFFRWRYVNNDHPVFRQVTAGRIQPQATASLLAPVTGVQFTNAPTTNRRSFGTYRLSNKTEPDWVVELYMNDILINYTKADASGFYTFDIPLVYGNTQVKLRFYGPWGEEKTEEQFISIPFNFVPEHQLQYTVSAGIVNDEQKNRYSRAAFNYGLSKHITIGGGTEYLSSVSSGKNMPFVNASVRFGSGLLFSGEHAYGILSRMVLNYRLPSNIRVDLSYTSYDREQKAVWFVYHEEKKATISMPIRTKKFNAFSRLAVSQLSTRVSEPSKHKSNYTTGELLLSGSFKNIGTNFTLNAALPNASSDAWVFSNLSLTFRLPKGFRITPQAQYDFTRKSFSLIRAEAEKNLFRNGFANLNVERNLIYRSSSFGLGFRYNFSFTQASFFVRRNNKSTAFVQNARGSILYDSKTSHFTASNNTNVGRGGVVVKPFLDLNCNGKRDGGEPLVDGLKLHVNGGRVTHNAKDTTITISGLEPYNNYYLELDKNSFENVSWQIRKSVIKVTVEPNHFKSIEVPVAVAGEVAGKVVLTNKEGSKGLGRIIVKIYDQQSKLVAKTLTESDGYFSYMGLAPGTYTARIDADQLAKIKMVATAEFQAFTIEQKKDGDIADGIEFVLQEL